MAGLLLGGKACETLALRTVHSTSSINALLWPHPSRVPYVGLDDSDSIISKNSAANGSVAYVLDGQVTFGR